jgi:hypothetical protein
MLDFFTSRYSSMRTHVYINIHEYEDTCGGMGCFSCLRQAFCRCQKNKNTFFFFSHAMIFGGHRDKADQLMPTPSKLTS